MLLEEPLIFVATTLSVVGPTSGPLVAASHRLLLRMGPCGCHIRAAGYRFNCERVGTHYHDGGWKDVRGIARGALPAAPDVCSAADRSAAGAAHRRRRGAARRARGGAPPLAGWRPARGRGRVRL